MFNCTVNLFLAFNPPGNFHFDCHPCMHSVFQHSMQICHLSLFFYSFQLTTMTRAYVTRKSGRKEKRTFSLFIFACSFEVTPPSGQLISLPFIPREERKKEKDVCFFCDSCLFFICHGRFSCILFVSWK